MLYGSYNMNHIDLMKSISVYPNCNLSLEIVFYQNWWRYRAIFSCN